jgi:hypothetical protein
MIESIERNEIPVNGFKGTAPGTLPGRIVETRGKNIRVEYLGYEA